MKITARQIEDLLAARHSGDVFVTQCKTGPTHGVVEGGLRIMDAWAMAKSWSNPKITAYEIKVSRSDFLGDDKWRSYLDFCNEFYFVCPSHIIEPPELPEEAGLVWTSKNAARLYTKKKAPHRGGEISESVFRYVLMCRAKITKDCCRESGLDYWRGWLNERDERRDIGRIVSRAIRDRITTVERENRRLAEDAKEMKAIRDELVSLGLLDASGYASAYAVGRRAEQLSRAENPVNKATGRLLREARSAIDNLIKHTEQTPPS